jgi:2-C-methyl-D-erythritol 4-phosphate cytidylyltransferase
MSRTAAILLAAGSSRRMDGAVSDKILAPLAGKPVFAHSAATFYRSGVIDTFIVTYRDQQQMVELSAYAPTPTLFVPGGSERQDSVAAALAELPDDVGYVFIHDCARPLVRVEQLDRKHLWAMETPQVFSRKLIDRAYATVAKRNVSITDDAAAVELLKHPVALLENPHPNPKLTQPADLAYLEFLLASTGSRAPFPT